MEELFQREAAGEQLRGALHHLSIAVRARAGSAPNRVFHEKIIRTRGLLAPRPLRKFDSDHCALYEREAPVRAASLFKLVHRQGLEPRTN